MMIRILIMSTLLCSLAHAQNSGTTGGAKSTVYLSASTAQDFGDQVNATIASLPLYRGKPCGVIVLPGGTFSYSTTIVVNSPYVLIEGQGTVLTYTGAGEAILFNDAPVSYDGHGGLSRIILLGTPAAAVGLHIREISWNRFQDVTIEGFTNGVGILFENISKWTENNTFDLLHIQNNAVGMKFVDNCPGNSGCYSFSYNRYRHLAISVPDYGTGMLFKNDIQVGGSDIEVSFFLGQQSTAIHLADRATSLGTRWKIVGEPSYLEVTSAQGIVTDVGTEWQPVAALEWWLGGVVADAFQGKRIAYIHKVPGYGFLQDTTTGFMVGAEGNPFTGTMDMSAIKNYRTYSFPDRSSTLATLDGDQTFTGKGIFNGGISTGGSGSPNKVVCWKDTAHIGYCSTLPDQTGSCACN